jgi:hypothetical protein
MGNTAYNVVSNKKFKCGAIYSGDTYCDNPHGKGHAKFASGWFYSGDWKHGAFHGYGQLTHPSGSIYTGHFVNRQFNGHGHIFYPNVNVTYVGGWKDNKWHGIGLTIYPSGSAYTREYNLGKLHGQYAYIPHPDQDNCVPTIGQHAYTRNHDFFIAPLPEELLNNSVCFSILNSDCSKLLYRRIMPLNNANKFTIYFKNNPNDILYYSVPDSKNILLKDLQLELSDDPLSVFGVGHCFPNGINNIPDQNHIQYLEWLILDKSPK